MLLKAYYYKHYDFLQKDRMIQVKTLIKILI